MISKRGLFWIIYATCALGVVIGLGIPVNTKLNQNTKENFENGINVGEKYTYTNGNSVTFNGIENLDYIMIEEGSNNNIYCNKATYDIVNNLKTGDWIDNMLLYYPEKYTAEIEAFDKASLQLKCKKISLFSFTISTVKSVSFSSTSISSYKDLSSATTKNPTNNIKDPRKVGLYESSKLDLIHFSVIDSLEKLEAGLKNFTFYGFFLNLEEETKGVSLHLVNEDKDVYWRM